MRIEYYIKGVNDALAAEELAEAIGKSLPECEVVIDDDLTTLTVSGEFGDGGKERERVEELLLARKIEFMRAEKGETYVICEKRLCRIPLLAAICAVIAAIVISSLATFAICLTIKKPEAPQYLVIDTPKQFENLVKLDEFFKEHSFDGYDEDEMAEAILDAYISATGDVYAEYLNAEEYDAYFDEREGHFVGIGVSIISTELVLDGIGYKAIEIISVFKDTPAMEHGVQVGDLIMYVEHEGELTLVDSIGYTQASDDMLGEAGTYAHFIVYRPDGGDYVSHEFSIERREVNSESVTYKVSETDSEVGIVQISGFDLTTPLQFKEAISVLRDVYKVKYFVFDLRNNHGGSLDSIETVLTYFLNKGDEIYSLEYADGTKVVSSARTKRYNAYYSNYNVSAEEIGMYRDLDFIVLTNGNTASAAELFTATMRDYSLAEIVGQKTYGKGCMQTIFPLDSIGIEGGLKLTVAMYYSASKIVYHGTGIVPDHEIELSDEAKKINFYILPEDKDAQLQKAIELLTK